MRRLAYIFLLLVVTLSACKKEEEPDLSQCSFCGDYEGDISGELGIALGMDTLLTDLPNQVSISRLGDVTYNVKHDLSAMLGAAPGTLVIDIDGLLIGDNIVFTNVEYVYSGIASINVAGLIDVSTPDSIMGYYDLSGDAWGYVNFELEKQ